MKENNIVINQIDHTNVIDVVSLPPCAVATQRLLG